MNKVLKDLHFTIAYLDDIIIYTNTSEESLDHLQQVSYKLCNVELTMKLSKCYFFSKEIQYLGHVLSIKPLPSKAAAIKLVKPSKDAKHVKAFLGLVSYYHRFYNNFLWIARPYTALTMMQSLPGPQVTSQLSIPSKALC